MSHAMLQVLQWLIFREPLCRYVQGTLSTIASGNSSMWRVIAGTPLSDWAGQPDRKSVSGGVMVCDGMRWMLFGSVVEIFEGPCHVISGASALQFGLCLRHTWNPRALLDLNLTCRPVLRSDRSFALAITGDRRLRYMKHFDVRLLAIQQCVAEQRFSMCKVGTSTNVADLLATHVSNAVHSFLMPVLGSQRPGAFCLSTTIQCVGEVFTVRRRRLHVAQWPNVWLLQRSSFSLEHQLVLPSE